MWWGGVYKIGAVLVYAVGRRGVTPRLYSLFYFLLYFLFDHFRHKKRGLK
jgi:hypothetical protein